MIYKLNRKLILESLSFEIAVSNKEILKELPTKYHKCYENFKLNSTNQYNKDLMNDVKFFYKNTDTVNNVFDFIPIGCNNGDYLCYNVLSKKLEGVTHDSNHGKNGKVLKEDIEVLQGYAEHLTAHAKVLASSKAKDAKSLEKLISKAAGFKVQVFDLDDNIYKGYKYVEFYAGFKDSLDNFGSKKLENITIK